MVSGGNLPFLPSAQTEIAKLHLVDKENDTTDYNSIQDLEPETMTDSYTEDNAPLRNTRTEKLTLEET